MLQNKKKQKICFGKKMLTLGVDICIWGVHATFQMEMCRRQLDMKFEVWERSMDCQWND